MFSFNYPSILHSFTFLRFIKTTNCWCCLLFVHDASSVIMFPSDHPSGTSRSLISRAGSRFEHTYCSLLCILSAGVKDTLLYVCIKMMTCAALTRQLSRRWKKKVQVRPLRRYWAGAAACNRRERETGKVWSRCRNNGEFLAFWVDVSLISSSGGTRVPL